MWDILFYGKVWAGDYLKPNIYSVGHMVWLRFYVSLNFQFKMTIYLKSNILRQRGSSPKAEPERLPTKITKFNYNGVSTVIGHETLKVTSWQLLLQTKKKQLWNKYYTQLIDFIIYLNNRLRLLYL